MFKKKKEIYELLHDVCVKERQISEQARAAEDKYMLKYMELEQEFDKLVYENKKLRSENRRLREYMNKLIEILPNKKEK